MPSSWPSSQKRTLWRWILQQGMQSRFPPLSLAMLLFCCRLLLRVAPALFLRERQVGQEGQYHCSWSEFPRDLDAAVLRQGESDSCHVPCHSCLFPPPSASKILPLTSRCVACDSNNVALFPSVVSRCVPLRSPLSHPPHNAHVQYGSNMAGPTVAKELGDVHLVSYLHGAQRLYRSRDTYAWLFVRMCGLSPVATSPTSGLLQESKDDSVLDARFNPFFADAVFSVFDAILTVCGTQVSVRVPSWRCLLALTL
jgi:hypothetical protein